MLRRGMRSRTGSINDERGASMAEYMPLLGVVAILVIVAVTFLGPWVSEQLGDASVPFDPDSCPPGWALTYANTVDKKTGQDVNMNGDPFVCVKHVAENGEGNTGVGTNVKDNNRPTP